jgi:hypothetical protein
VVTCIKPPGSPFSPRDRPLILGVIRFNVIGSGFRPLPYADHSLTDVVLRSSAPRTIGGKMRPPIVTRTEKRACAFS